jgi:hypothetical protein
MKQSINPAVATVVIVIVVAVVGFFLWRGANGGAGSIPPGGVGNPGPFAPGGAANKSQGAARPANAAGGGGNPAAPR